MFLLYFLSLNLIFLFSSYYLFLFFIIVGFTYFVLQFRVNFINTPSRLVSLYHMSFRPNIHLDLHHSRCTSSIAWSRLPIALQPDGRRGTPSTPQYRLIHINTSMHLQHIKCLFTLYLT